VSTYRLQAQPLCGPLVWLSVDDSQHDSHGAETKGDATAPKLRQSRISLLFRYLTRLKFVSKQHVSYKLTHFSMSTISLIAFSPQPSAHLVSF